MAAAEKKKELPHVKALCPLTGMIFGTKRVEPHFAIATTCKGNDAIYIYCMLHNFRGFIKHPQIVEMLNAEGRSKTEAARPAPARPV